MLEGRFLWSSVLTDENGVIASAGLSSGSGRSELQNHELKALITIVLHCFLQALVSFQFQNQIFRAIVGLVLGTTSPEMTEMASIKLFTVNVCWNGSTENGEL